MKQNKRSNADVERVREEQALEPHAQTFPERLGRGVVGKDGAGCLVGGPCI